MKSLKAHDEEEPRQDSVWYQMEDDEKRTRHGAKGKEALGKIGHTLFDNVGCFERILSLVFTLFIEFLDGFGDTKRFCVEGCLWDQAIWKG